MESRLNKDGTSTFKSSGFVFDTSGTIVPLTPVDDILTCLKKHDLTLGKFLVQLFSTPTRKEDSLSPAHSQTVSIFLGGRSDVHVSDVIELMYNSRYASPRAIRQSTTEASAETTRSDPEKMGRRELEKWAVQVVERLVDKEAEDLASKDGGLRLPLHVTWDFIKGYSLDRVLSVCKETSPTLVCILAATAIPHARRELRAAPSPATPHQDDPPTLFHTPAPSGRGNNRRNPWVIITVALLMLLNARNLRFTCFQKLLSVWLFASGVAHDVFGVLGRLGLSVSYTTTLALLDKLSKGARDKVRKAALSRTFLLIYDNINRKRHVWDPELGERDVMDSGTAASFVLLEDCDPEKAFDTEAFERARDAKQRKALDYTVLHKRVDWQHLNDVFAVHVVSFLVQDVDSLSHFHPTLNERLRTTLARHRMRSGCRTNVSPLATSDYDEGSTGGNQSVLDDLMLKQLGLSKDEISKIMTIVGGDQSTVEKIRTLKKFLESCPHGYARYGWILPLIQLWHMGWADLERIISTHWGGTSHSDMSGLSFINERLGRKVKDMKRPDYYPAQALVFDTLHAEILDCWREHLHTDDLNAYFSKANKSLDQLLHDAATIVQTYMSTEASDRALYTINPDNFFVSGDDWKATPTDASDSPVGDQVLANVILRMRDSMMHYEFQSAIADGDIGRAMNIMAVWTFTFCGSGKSKYTNELLEIACNFEYEYSDDLKTAVLNNWLCNLTGLDGCWFPMDLLQEHNIKQLKKMSDRRHGSFSDTFFREIISYNIRYFLEIKDSLRAALGLGGRGGSHRRKKKAIALKLLGKHMSERQLHRFRAGRTYGHQAKDNFAAGYEDLSTSSRIHDFIERTLNDAGNLHAAEDMDRMDIDGEDEMENVPVTNLRVPNMWREGLLIPGDEGDETDEDEDDNERMD